MLRRTLFGVNNMVVKICSDFLFLFLKLTAIRQNIDLMVIIAHFCQNDHLSQSFILLVTPVLEQRKFFCLG